MSLRVGFGAGAAACWVLLFGWPLAALVLRLSPGGLLQGMLDPLVLSKVGFTVRQAGLSAVVSGALGLWVGWLARKDRRAMGWLRVPFGVPTLAAVAAWTGILSGRGWAHSLQAVLLAHVFFNVPWVALAVAEAAGSVPRASDEAARTLGAGAWDRLRSVWWPVIGPAWLSAIVQVFVFCSTSFVIVLVLGGGPPVETIETAIYASVRTGVLDLDQACRLALWQLVLSMVPWIGVRLLFRGIHLRGPAGSHPGGRGRVALAASGFWLLPYLFFLWEVAAELSSVIGQRPEFWPEFWPELWQELRWPLFMSIGISLLSAFGTLAWAGVAVAGVARAGRYSRLLEFLFGLPAGASTLTLCMGFWMAYSQWIDPFEGSLIALVGIQMVVFFPLVFRWLLPLVQSRPHSLIELARSQGAGAWQVFREVEWPRLRQPVWSALVLVCAGSLGEVAAVSFFGSEMLATAPMLAARWMGSYRFDKAMLLIGILTVTAALLSWSGNILQSGRGRNPWQT